MTNENVAPELVQKRVTGELVIHDPVLEERRRELTYKMIKKQFSQGTKKCRCGRVISMNKLSCLECSKIISVGDECVNI